jgi:hypothetical protein
MRNVDLVEIELTEISKGNGTIEIKKTCPSCSHEMFFGVQNRKITYTDSVVYWNSSKGELIRCINCEAVYRLDVKETL